jgi:hypothetical protein
LTVKLKNAQHTENVLIGSEIQTISVWYRQSNEFWDPEPNEFWDPEQSENLSMTIKQIFFSYLAISANWKYVFQAFQGEIYAYTVAVN